jgi:hypothetical protein
MEERSRGRDKIRGTSEPLKSVLEPLNGSRENRRGFYARWMPVPLEALKGENGEELQNRSALCFRFQAVSSPD